MVHYETLLLAKTESTEEELKALESFFDKAVSEARGTVHIFDRWGKLKLSYPIKNNNYGIYALVRYSIPDDADIQGMLNEVHRFLKIKCHAFILRHLTKNLLTSAAAPYIKPETSAAPRESFDSFLKESKIENLLTSVDTAQKPGAEEDDEENN